MSGLRERKKDETRRMLQRVALELFVERGFHAVTVGELAAAADVSPRTVFRYFPTKEDLVLWDDMGEIVDAIEALPAGTQPLAGMRFLMQTLIPAKFAMEREVIEARFRVLGAAPELWNRLNEVHQHMADTLAPTFARLAGVPEDDFALRIFLRATTTVFDVAMQEWLRTGQVAELPAIVARGLDLLAAGLPVGGPARPRLG